MNLKTYRQIRVLVALFLGFLISLAISLDNFMLAAIAVAAGAAVILLVKSKVKDVVVDERVQLIGDKAARAAYSILSLVLGIGSLLLVLFGRMKESNAYLEGLGYILAYLAIFSIMTYSAAFWYFDRKYGSGGKDDQ